jgi:hypothetical protein
VKRTLATGLVGTASVGTTAAALAKVEAPWQVVALAVFAVVLLAIAALVESVITLRRTLQTVDQLTAQRYAGSFKGPCGVELKGSLETASAEPEPLKPKRWPRRKPLPDS